MAAVSNLMSPLKSEPKIAPTTGYRAGRSNSIATLYQLPYVGRGGDSHQFDYRHTNLDWKTNRFLDNSALEQEFQKAHADSHKQTVTRLMALLFIVYVVFTLPIWKGSADAQSSQLALKYISLAPIPLMIYLLNKFPARMQDIMALVVFLFSLSFIVAGGGGMYFSHKDRLTTGIDIIRSQSPGETWNSIVSVEKSATYNGMEWTDDSMSDKTSKVIERFLTEAFLGQLEAEISVMRPLIVLTVSPIMRFHFLQFVQMAVFVNILYIILIFGVVAPDNPGHTLQYKIAGIVLVPVVTVFIATQVYAMERFERLEFLQVRSVEKEVHIAINEKNAFASENASLKKILNSEMNKVDLESPMTKILTDLKSIFGRNDVPVEVSHKVQQIFLQLGLRKDSLYTPDIRVRLNEGAGNEIDKDTKNWAMDVLQSSRYRRSRKSNWNVKNINEGSASDSGEIHAGVTTEKLEPGVELHNQNLLEFVMEQMEKNSFNTDMLELVNHTNRPLFYVTLAVFEKHDLCQALNVDRIFLTNFLHAIDTGYQTNPYHNACHAADVVNSMEYSFTTLNDGKMAKLLTQEEFFASVLAGAVHDYQHPGKTNLFMVKVKHDLAIRYSDTAVLERMHVAEAFFVSRRKNCNVFSGLNDKQYVQVRKAIIEMVLATDLSIHLEVITNLKTLAVSDHKEEIVNDPMLLMKVVIKLCDIGHSAKTLQLHVKWSSAIIEEFFQQGDEEKEQGLPVSPFMDRDHENSAKNQIGFFEFIVLPFYNVVGEVIFVEGSTFATGMLHNVRKNHLTWKQAELKGYTSIDTIRQKAVELEDLVDQLAVPAPAPVAGPSSRSQVVPKN